MRRGLAGLVALVLLLVVGYVVLTGADDSLEVVPGLVASDIEGSSSAVRIPTGELAVTIDEPLRGVLGADVIEGLEDREPPSGGSFLPIRVAFDAFASIQGATVMAAEPQELEAILKVDGRTIALPRIYSVVPVGQVEGINSSTPGRAGPRSTAPTWCSTTDSSCVTRGSATTTA